MGPPGPKSGGVKYTRWGKMSCPSGVDLVYKGTMGTVFCFFCFIYNVYNIL